MSIANTLWILIGTAAMFFMQIGFAMVEAGFVREKNVSSILAKNLMNLCIGILMFWFIGFGLTFGNAGGIFGKIDFFAVGNYKEILPAGISRTVYFAFQAFLCITASCIVSGGMAGRTKFSAYCVYVLIITAIIYPVSAHWIFGNGWLKKLGFHDFAGGMAVQAFGGIAAFCGSKVIGPRIGKFDKQGNAKAIPGHSVTSVVIGIFILWLGWLGYTACSVGNLTEVNLAVIGQVVVNVLIAAAAGACTSMLVSWKKYQKPDVSITFNGVIGGLVAVTAGADVISAYAALIIGILAGFVVVYGVAFAEQKLHIDDPVGAVGIHAGCGILGTIAVGIFSQQNGLIHKGGFYALFIQCLGVMVVTVWVSVAMMIVFKVLDKTIGLRVSEREEIEGLDSTEHGVRNAFVTYLPSVEKEALSHKRKEDVPKDAVITIRDSRVKTVEGTEPTLTKIEIVTRESKFEELKSALNAIGVTGMTVSHVTGCGVQKGATEFYRGAPMDMTLLPKVCVKIVVSKVPVEQVVAIARSVLYSGHIGDGKIFIYDVRDVVKVRTGETGYDALQGIEEVES